MKTTKISQIVEEMYIKLNQLEKEIRLNRSNNIKSPKQELNVMKILSYLEKKDTKENIEKNRLFYNKKD